MVSTTLLDAGSMCAPRPASARPAPADLLVKPTVRGRVATLRFIESAHGDAAGTTASLTAALAMLDRKVELSAVVLRGRQLFDGDAIAECLGHRAFQAVLRALAGCALPTVAAIEANATGAGLELALACGSRVARGDATFSLPGVKIARLPVHGGAQQLPLLIGYDAAARMIVHGETVNALEALRIGLIDAVDVENIDRFAEGWRSPRPRWGRRHLTATEKTAADVTLLGESQRLKRAFSGQAAPMAALRAMAAGIGASEREATAEALRLDEKLAHLEEAAALSHAARGARALAEVEGLGEARLGQLALRARWPMVRETVHLLDEGTSPAQVDRCLTAYGFAAGPFAQSDRQGLNALFQSGAAPEDRDWLTYSPTLDLMVDAGRIGGSGNKGWYQASDGACAALRSDPGVERLLDGSAVSQRLRRQPLADGMISRRCLYAAINGTAALVQAYPRLNAWMLDAIWTTRLGFPRWKGGPLFQAALVGYSLVAAEMEVWRARRDTAGAPAAPLARLLADLEPSLRSGAVSDR